MKCLGLYIEDNPDDVFLMQELVAEIAIIRKIDTCSTLSEGKELIKKNQYDILFVDLSLPDSKGTTIIDEIQRLNGNLPIIVFTGLDDEYTALSAINKGAQDYLVKGTFDQRSLAKSISYALERVKNKLTLSKVQASLKKAEEMSLMGNWEISLDGKEVVLSEGLQRIYGLPDKHFFVGIESYYERIHPKDFIRIRRRINRLIKTGVSTSYQERIYTVHGDLRYLETKVELLHDSVGHPRAIFGASVDITIPKRYENDLQESEDQLLEAQEIAKIGSWRYNPLSNLIEGSPQVYNILGYERTNKIYLDDAIDLIVLEEDKIELNNIMQRAITNSESFDFMTQIKLPDCTIKYIEIKTKVIAQEKYAQSDIIGGTIQDITIVKEAQLALERFAKTLEVQVEERTHELLITKEKLERSLEKEKELGQMRSHFVSTVSHQFRTPLTVIQASVGLLEMQATSLDDKLSPALNKASQRIKYEVTRMTTLMNDILILSKINSGNISYKPVPINIKEVLDKVIVNHNQIQEDGRKAVLLKVGQERTLCLDPNLLEHSISNLLSNAFKYSKNTPPPTIQIDFSDEKKCYVMVQDQGIGIPENELGRIFEQFYRASNARAIKGTGLGTAIIKEYVELNGGTIRVESIIDKGTCFIVAFDG